MSLEQFLKERLQEKGQLLMTHVICSYPSFEENMQALEVMEACNVDVVELQFPFSEPSADGPLFVSANQKALQNGVTIDQCFEFLEEVNKRFSFKTLMMGYYNTVFKMSEEVFIQRLKKAKASGFIIADLPLEEASNLNALAKANDLSPILIMTPTHSEERLKAIADNASGFVYAVARRGVTGKDTDMTDEVTSFLKKCKDILDIPLAVGFGIKTKEDVAFLKDKADIAIIGTQLLRLWQENKQIALKEFLSSLET